MIQKQYKNVFWTLCTMHALKDIRRFDWLQKLIEDGRKINTFICNYNHLEAIYQKFAKDFLKPANTQFASFFIFMKLREHHDPL